MMAKFYAINIMAGRTTLDKVPSKKLRRMVKKELELAGWFDEEEAEEGAQ